MIRSVNDKAEYYHKQGLRLFSVGQLQQAVDFFTKAIEIDPQFPDAYLHRGGIFLETNRIVEGNSDIQKAKDLRSGKFRGKIKGKFGEGKTEKAVKVNWQEVDSIYDAVFPIDSHATEKDTLQIDGRFDYADTIDTEEAWKGPVSPASEGRCYSAVLELVNGKRVEVAKMRLFEPTNNDISIIRQDGHVERVIPLKHIACIRQAEIPPKLYKRKNSLCHAETIETVGGKISHVAIHPEQVHENVLFGFSTENQARLIYKFIPVVNIRKRCQDRYLGEILLEKRFIGKDILQQALQEHQQAKRMKLGKIIAQKAQIIHSIIEEELERAKQAKVKKRRKTGEILLSSGLVNEGQVVEALQHQESLHNMRIGQFLIKKGVVQEKEVYLALAEKFRMPFVDLRRQKIFRKTLTVLSENFVMENEILPIAFDNDKLTVAVLNPDISYLREKIIKECKCNDVRFVLALPTHLRTIIGLLSKKSGFTSGKCSC
jgi:tetratricopeptide (TPR) repeat protein